MEAIAKTILSVIKDLEAKKAGLPDDNPQGLLKKVLTKKELGHIKFNYFRKGLLGVSVDSSAWMYNLNLKKEKLLDALKKEDSRVKDLRFRIGDIS